MIFASGMSSFVQSVTLLVKWLPGIAGSLSGKLMFQALFTGIASPSQATYFHAGASISVGKVLISTDSPGSSWSLISAQPSAAVRT